jgi:hypothetical protein
MRILFVFIIFIFYCACKDFNNSPPITVKDSANVVREFLDKDTLCTVHEIEREYKLIPHNTYLTYKETYRGTDYIRKDTTILKSDALGMYEINVPRSHKYEIELKNGSKVWLNAATKFRFNADPTDTLTFEVLGEGYFINKKAAIIKLADNKIYCKAENKINIRCYKNEPSRIWLLKGIGYINSTLFKSGDCASLNGQISISKGCCRSDLEEPIAWTKGLISFENKNCREAFNDISRWYKYIEYYGCDTCDVTGKLPLSLNTKEFIYFLQLNRFRVSYRLDSSFGVLIKP